MITDEYDIFISYRRSYSLEVEHVYGELIDQFPNIFFDQDAIHTGKYFNEVILSSIKASKVFLLVLTKDVCMEFENRDTDDDWLLKEIDAALKNNIPILPVFLYDEEYAKEINELMRKGLGECIPGEISFLTGKQFYKVRLERRARKSDIIGLANEIKLEINNKNIINAIGGNQADTIEKEPEEVNTSFSWKTFIASPVVLVFLGYFGYMKFFNTKDIIPPEIPKSEQNKTETVLTTNEDPSNIPTLSVTNMIGTKWFSSVHVNSGDRLAFDIHYYGWYKGINDLKVYLADLRDEVYAKGDSVTVEALTEAKNLNPSKGRVEVFFDDDVKLKLKYILWQKNKCKSKKCATNIPGDTKSIFTDKGLYLGDIFARDSSDYFGNVVVRYDVVKSISHKKKDSKKLTPNQSPNNLKKENKLLSPNMGKINTLLAGTTKGSSEAWHETVYVNSSIQLSLDLHYNTQYMGAKNLRAFLDDLNNKVFKTGEEIEVHGMFTAEKLSPANGSAKLVFEENVKLLFKSVSWQIWPCQKVECETEIKGNINDLFSEQGLLIGDLDKNDDSHYSGNIVVSYKVIKVSKK